MPKLAGSPRIVKWLSFEMYGYNKTDPVSEEYLEATGRIINRQIDFVLWGSFAAQLQGIENTGTRLMSIKPEKPDTSPYYHNTYAASEAKTLRELLAYYQRVRSNVVALMHDFAANVYYKRAFSALTESLFERFKIRVDKLLADRCGSVLEEFLPYTIALAREIQKRSAKPLPPVAALLIHSLMRSTHPPKLQ